MYVKSLEWYGPSFNDHVSTPHHVSFGIHYIFFRHKSSPYTDQIFLSTNPKTSVKMVKFWDVRSVKTPAYPSLFIWAMLLVLISAGGTNTKGPANTQFFKTLKPQMSPKYVYDGSTVNGFLPKALPTPPSGPSHHHNSISINTMNP